MRYGVLSDIHGNLHALRAVLERLRSEGVDAFLCAGDLVGYGPLPNECVDTIAQLPGVCVAGNHELLVLGRLPTDRCGNLARLTLDWTRNVLREDVCRYLSALPVRAEVPGEVVLTHASLDDPQQYIRDPDQAAAQLDLLAVEHPLAGMLIIGHTHRSWAFGRRAGSLAIPRNGQVRLQPGQPYLLNPGSVGQSRYRERVPRARCLLLDLDQGRATFYALAYDVEGCRRELRRQGLPERSYHVPGSWRRGAAHRLRSYVRRAIARASGRG